MLWHDFKVVVYTREGEDKKKVTIYSFKSEDEYFHIIKYFTNSNPKLVDYDEYDNVFYLIYQDNEGVLSSIEIIS